MSEWRGSTMRLHQQTIHKHIISTYGFTLVELVLSVTILVAVVASLLYMFTSGFFTITMSGRRSEVDFELQEAAEQYYSSSTIGTEHPDVTPMPSPGVTISINLPSHSPLSASGEVAKLVKNEDGRELSIELFIPDN
jgi:Tfp pilus assembly protein PilE